MFRLLEKIESKLQEMKFEELKREQASIFKLFPSFQDRVRQVKNKGGAKMTREDATHWYFSVASASTPGKTYEVTVEFTDLNKVLLAKIADLKNWRADKQGLNFNIFPRDVFFNTDLKLGSNSPGDLYWGQSYLRTQKDVQAGAPEDRSPEIRNPEHAGLYGKHVAVVMEVMPFYISTFGQFLKKFYGKTINAEITKIMGERNKMTQAANALTQKKQEQEAQVKAAKPANMFQRGEVPPAKPNPEEKK